MQRPRFLPAASLVALLLPFLPPASAGPANDPRIAINALNTPGDGTSLFRITAPGSYYLERNETGVADKHGIQVLASNVHIDLMGFQLTGVTDSLSAILSTVAPTPVNLSVRNGTITGWPQHGVAMIASSNVALRDLLLSDLGLPAIEVGPHSVVERCRVFATHAGGILAMTNALITDCVVAEVGIGTGIAVGTDSTIRACKVSAVGGTGIEASSGSLVSSCTVTGAGGPGVLMATGTVENCNVGQNIGNGITIAGGVVRDCNVQGNQGHGLQVGSESALIVGNQVTNNLLDGIRCASGARIEQNHIRSHPSGVGIRVTGNACFVARNTLLGNATALSVPNAGNFVGPLVHVNAVNGRNEPWANFHG